MRRRSAPTFSETQRSVRIRRRCDCVLLRCFAAPRRSSSPFVALHRRSLLPAAHRCAQSPAGVRSRRRRRALRCRDRPAESTESTKSTASAAPAASIRTIRRCPRSRRVTGVAAHAGSRPANARTGCPTAIARIEARKEPDIAADGERRALQAAHHPLSKPLRIGGVDSNPDQAESTPRPRSAPARMRRSASPPRRELARRIGEFEFENNLIREIAARPLPSPPEAASPRDGLATAHRIAPKQSSASPRIFKSGRNIGENQCRMPI